MTARALIVASALGVVVPAALAREVAYDFVVCNHARQTVLEANADLVALGVEQWGVVSSSSTREWDGATTRCVGALRLVGGKPIGKGLCKWFHANGDTAIGEWEYPATGDPTWTWLAGTGGLKGISGSGHFKPTVNGKPAEAGTSQSCRQDWGRYTLP